MICVIRYRRTIGLGVEFPTEHFWRHDCGRRPTDLIFWTAEADCYLERIELDPPPADSLIDVWIGSKTVLIDLPAEVFAPVSDAKVDFFIPRGVEVQIKFHV